MNTSSGTEAAVEHAENIRPAYFLAEITGFGYVQITPGWGEFKRSSVNEIIRVAYNFREAKLPALGYIPESNTRAYAWGEQRLKTPGLHMKSPIVGTRNEGSKVLKYTYVGASKFII